MEIILREITARDIQKQAEKVLRGLGNPEPPLRLEDVLELLRLDRQYYSSSNDGVVREVVSRITVAGKQILERPAILIDAIRKFSLKSLYIPDRNRILIDSELPAPKQRWSGAHEVAHHIISWHQDTMLGDDKLTLRPGCHAQIEAEANYGAGQLLFLGKRFVEESRSLPADIQTVLDLQKRFGNTITTTLWRYVEQTDKCWVGSISVHPNRVPADFDSSQPLRYFIGSRSFQEQFSSIDPVRFFSELQQYCGRQRGGPLGEAEVVLPDDDGDEHVFLFKTFFNTYDALTFGTYVRRHELLISAGHSMDNSFL